MTLCPLCESDKTQEQFEAKALRKKRIFFLCEECDLLFVPNAFHPSRDVEKGQYDLHQNCGENEGYLNHLKPVVESALKLVAKGGRILDYGCGPGPVLAEELKSKGRSVATYDPFFQSEPVEGPFDLVTCTEVVEHFSNPKKSLEKLFQVVGEGSLIVMTSLTDGVESLRDWHYIRDITHVSFYSQKTMLWIAERFRKKNQFVEENVILFQ